MPLISLDMVVKAVMLHCTVVTCLLLSLNGKMNKILNWKGSLVICRLYAWNEYKMIKNEQNVKMGKVFSHL